MKKYLSFLVVLLCLAFLQAQEHYYEKTIQDFEKSDKEKSQPSEAILFIGSSSIRGWKTLAEDFPETNVINRGFGGSHTSDVLHFIDRIVIPYKPRAIVFYCGENDISAGKPYTTPVANFIEFVSHIRKHLPQTKIYYLSMKPSPSRWKIWEEMVKANTDIRAFCEQNKTYQKEETLFYVDISKAMLNQNNEPDPEIFIPDMLHMNAKGYKIWTEIVKSDLIEHGSLEDAKKQEK